MLGEILRMSVANIISNKTRSMLTVLGIVIGVGSIIALMFLGDGVTGSIQDQLADLGGHKLTINIGGTPIKKGLSDQDMRSLASLENVLYLSPSTGARSSLVYRDIRKTGVSIAGRSHTFFAGERQELTVGRGIHRLDVENRSHVAVLGATLARELFIGRNPVGAEILIGGRRFTVVGVLAEAGAFTLNSLDHSVVVPYNTAERVLGGGRVSSLDVYFLEGTDAKALTGNVEAVLTAAFDGRNDVFDVFNLQNLLDVTASVTNTITLFITGIAGISLLVGGIGIMNMMLVSVTERTNEIGLRKSLGAKPIHIMTQFLIEAVIICLLGGLFGVIIGSTLAYVGSRLIGIRFVLSFYPIALALGFSGIVGLIFGIDPARRASRLNPIDALRRV